MVRGACVPITPKKKLFIVFNSRTFSQLSTMACLDLLKGVALCLKNLQILFNILFLLLFSFFEFFLVKNHGHVGGNVVSGSLL